MKQKQLTVRQKKIKNITLDIGADIIGSFIFAIGLICFIEPANIAPGGASALSLIHILL